MADVVSLKRETGEGPVRSEARDGVLRITLANPPANALSLAAMAALRATLDEASADPAVRVIVIAASGKLFSAGHDLKEMTLHRADSDGGRAFFERTFSVCAELMQAIVRHDRPVIAEVDGIATAAGCQLVASCDLAIASDRATFGVNGIDVGLFCSTPAVALVRGLKPKHAMEMLLTGEMVDASSARELGLVNRVVPQEYLTQIVTKYAQTIAAKPVSVVRAGKRTFYEQVEMNLADAYAHASRTMVETMMGGDAEEGIGAFIGRRRPQWKDA